MARYIDADRMREDWLENGENEYVYDTNAVLQSIDNQPTADVVEVVRCKDCAFNHYKFCYVHDRPITSDDFCSDGKKVE